MTTIIATTPKEVLTFWLEELTPKQHFTKDEELDKTIKEKFLDLYNQAVIGDIDSWTNEPESCLAFIILIDQFSRNMFRETPLMYAADPLALEAAKKSIEKGFDKQVKKGRQFFYLPFMHSENLADQETCIKLFREMSSEPGSDSYAVQNRDIIKRFGRFPHRNNILSRESTKEEIEFLKQPGSSF